MIAHLWRMQDMDNLWFWRLSYTVSGEKVDGGTWRESNKPECEDLRRKLFHLLQLGYSIERRPDRPWSVLNETL